MSSPEVASPVRQPLKVLIVEDSAPDAELMVHELRRAGFEVNWERADKEPDFLACLAESPELILADYTLPQFSGPRALEILQERGLGIPFIVVSGTIGEDRAVAMVKEGAADFLLKSELPRLGPAVMRALQGVRKIAYFSMEIALESGIATYSGGLGVLAGDTIRSAADLQVPLVAVSLVHRRGYFLQRLDASGWQVEEAAEWRLEDYLTEMPSRARVEIEGRTVHLRCWKYEVKGVSGYSVPVYLLDSCLAENSDADQELTHVLYGGDSCYRLCQEIVLGIGGVRMLRALGYDAIERFHMNEGHASLLTLELLQEEARKQGRERVDMNDLAVVRPKWYLYDAHAGSGRARSVSLGVVSRVLGHQEDFSDSFASDVAARVFGRRQSGSAPKSFPDGQGMLNMTYLGLNMSRYVNGVAKKHGEVSRLMFAGYRIDAITNGVHAGTWTSPAFQALYDRHIPDWRQDNFSLRHAESIPKDEVWDAHMRAKTQLLEVVNQKAAVAMMPDVLTIGFARRATAYKRADLLFTEIQRLKKLAEAGGLQVIYAGKAHPSDQDGKQLIQRILRIKEELKDDISIAFVANYDMQLAKLMTAGVDLWLNTPQPPLEASGTSGMKAALNGIPSLSILDGWWLEGLIEGTTGWAIGGRDGHENTNGGSQDADSLYTKLEQKIIPIFYQKRGRFIDVMRHAIAVNGSFFNTQRMLQQYVLSAYFG